MLDCEIFSSFTARLSPVRMTNVMNDDQPVTLCRRVKLSFALTLFWGIFDIIIFKWTSLFQGSLVPLRDFFFFLKLGRVLLVHQVSETYFTTKDSFVGGGYN